MEEKKERNGAYVSSVSLGGGGGGGGGCGAGKTVATGYEVRAVSWYFGYLGREDLGALLFKLLISVAASLHFSVIEVLPHS